MASDGLATNVVSHVFALIDKDSTHSYAVGIHHSCKGTILSYCGFITRTT